MLQLHSSLVLRGPRGQAHERWIELLAALATRPSIAAAAKAVGLSYKAAWDAIDALNNLADRPLVLRAVGGRGGGGTRLTAAGEELVTAFRRAQRENAVFQRRLGRGAEAPPPAGPATLGRLTVKSSARNQYAGTVTRVKRGTVDTEVQLRLGGGEALVAVITRASAVRLGLKAGVPVMAWIKASSVILAPDTEGASRVSARNCLRGVVTRVVRGAVNSEVVIEFGGGNTIAATITHSSVRALGLRRGSRAAALFKASSVILLTQG
jgi:molybdate transport system regulatory protein